MVSEKADDGYSGVNFERPGFKEMMEEIRAGQGGLCDRQGYCPVLAGTILKQGIILRGSFRLFGVRFIAINDSYDSTDRNQSGFADHTV